MFAANSRRSHVIRIACAALVACLLLVGCGGDSGSSGSGGSDGADLSELEAKLVDLQENKAPNLDVQGAKCPAQADLEVGAEFECVVTIEGVEAPYAITLEGDSGSDSGSFHIEPALAIIDVSIVVNFLQGRVGDSADVSCGDEKVIVGDVGDTFDCTVDAGGQQQTVEMVIKDLDGKVAINS